MIIQTVKEFPLHRTESSKINDDAVDADGAQNTNMWQYNEVPYNTI